MNSKTTGFSVVEELRWRAWNGVIADVWSVQCSTDAEGEYVSPDPRLFVVLDMTGTGSLTLDVKSERGTYRHATVRSMSYVPAGVALHSRSDKISHLRHLDIHFDAAALTRRFASDFDAQALNVPRMVFQDDRIADFAALIAAECQNPQPLHDLYGDGLLNALFVDLFQIRQKAGRRRSQLSSVQLRRAKEYIEANCLRNIRLKELADLIGLSQAYFSHAFKASTGMPPHRWHLQARVAKVQELLSARDVSLTEVAVLAGFADQAHFTRVFKAVVGVTPATWLRNCNKLQAVSP